jgi:hypothetical protein
VEEVVTGRKAEVRNVAPETRLELPQCHPKSDVNWPYATRNLTSIAPMPPETQLEWPQRHPIPDFNSPFATRNPT